MLARSSGTGVLVVTLWFAAWLSLLPLPEAVVWLRPQWLLLVLLYWVVALPQRVGVFTALVVGLLADVLYGSVLGQHALAFSVSAWLALAVHQRFKVFPAVQQSLVVFLLVGVAVSIAYFVQDSSGRAQVSPLLMHVGSLVSALLWHPLQNLLGWVRIRFLVT